MLHPESPPASSLVDAVPWKLNPLPAAVDGAEAKSQYVVPELRVTDELGVYEYEEPIEVGAELPSKVEMSPLGPDEEKPLYNAKLKPDGLPFVPLNTSVTLERLVWTPPVVKLKPSLKSNPLS